MEYVFGTDNDAEILKTKGPAHTDLTGYQQTVREFPGQTITDNFRVIRKLGSDEDAEGNCYDWYEIDRHYRAVDETGAVVETLAEARAELEQLRTEVAAIQANAAPIMAAATAYALTAINIPDAQAIAMTSLFPTWEEVLSTGAELAAGRIISNDGRLYRVVQSVTPQANQIPGGEGMLAIYRPIDREHAGTLEDPIPWVYGMDCLAGVYYSYNDAIYRVADGGNMIPCVWAPDSGIWQWEIFG